MPRLFFALLVVVLAGPAAAQEAVQLPDSVTIDDALTLFRRHGLDLLIAEAAVTSAEGDVKTAGAVPNLGVSAYIGGSFFSCSGGQACPDSLAWGVGASDNNALEDTLSGKRHLRLKVARAALEAARLGRKDAQRQLEFTVKQQYIQTVLARDLLDFALDVQKGATQVFELNQVRYNSGAISEADLAKVEAAKLEADQAVDQASQALRAGKIGLAFLIGVRGRVPDYKVDQDLPKFVVPPQLANATVDSLLDLALSNRPDLKATRYQNERAEAAVASARRLRFPDIGMGLNYSQEGFGPGALTPPTLTFGLSATLPTFYQFQGEILRAQADLRVQSLQRLKIEAMVGADVQTALVNFEATRKLVERMETRLLDRARRARDLVQIQYSKGAASLLEFLDAQRTYISNNEEYLQDLANYWTAVFQLEQAVGMELRR